MKFAVLECLIIGAGLVASSPLRVIMVSSSSSEVTAHLRFGFPVAHAHAHAGNNVVTLSNGAAVAGTQQQSGAGRRPSCRFRQKAVGLSNSFRKALGLPPIEGHPKPDSEIHGGVIRIMPFIGTPPNLMAAPGSGEIHPHHRHGHGHHHHQVGQDATFVTRLHYSLTALSPWEGRVMAFVLGCGIGVLLRMLWVLAVISYRSIRGSKDEEEYVVEYLDAEEIFTAPPDYTLAEEKVPLITNTDNDMKTPVA
ncbi:hypothetical protein CCMSSC00406_0006600 [Pleurotus cornucopiae]|uniref:Uncharacterized protein n=1 Tax=Pleurotus cornucopiae TaxID=5321 RepID=A0ACB7IRK0_PLECO|nr:hypothetical protein CCMSSC00406_0006600 [Pleurotus cornucopiae]